MPIEHFLVFSLTVIAIIGLIVMFFHGGSFQGEKTGKKISWRFTTRGRR